MHYLDEGAGDPVLLPPRRADLVVPLPQDDPAARRASRASSRPTTSASAARTSRPTADWYSYDRHYASIARFVEELDLRELTVVVQDWGGPIGLRLAVEQPERVARLVILNTGIGAGRPPTDEWLRFREFVRRVGTDFEPGQLIRITCVTELSDEVVGGYDAPFPTPESKAGVLVFPELVPTEPEHPSRGAMLEIRDALERWEKPALVLFGDSDPIFSPPRPSASPSDPRRGPAETVANAGHFVQEDAGEEVAARIVRFLRARR